ncbi:MAG: dienelactone hydrolase family protein [Caulobacteraceae bacterium]|nr:dienelactone hydrolase family protein [Caulobacteraceae bacterium]
MPNQRWTIKTPDGDFDSYVALPEGEGPWPAVVAIQEIFGVNAVMREVCDRLADLGFLAVCPDLFWRIRPGIELTDRTPAEWKEALGYMNQLDFDKAMADIECAIHQIRARPDCTGKVGAVGYCLGGHLAFLAATRTNIDASVGYYGVNLQARLNETVKAPLMLHIAEADAYTPAEARDQVIAALQGNGLATLHVYAGRDHAFARPGGEHYHKADADLANQRTANFLGDTLA